MIQESIEDYRIHHYFGKNGIFNIKFKDIQTDFYLVNKCTMFEFE